MRHTILIAAASFLLTACGTVPKTSTQLVDSSGTTDTFCYEKPGREVGAAVEGFLGRCYGPVRGAVPVGGVLVPMQADFQVINEILPNGNRYSVRNFVGFGLAANVIDGAGGCETEVQMFAVSGFWTKAFTAIDQEIQGENPGCP